MQRLRTTGSAAPARYGGCRRPLLAPPAADLKRVLACVLGFMLAARLPVWATVALAFVLEAVVAYVIRDNLILNIIMLIYPFEAIKEWQLGA